MFRPFIVQITQILLKLVLQPEFFSQYVRTIFLRQNSGTSAFSKSIYIRKMWKQYLFKSNLNLCTSSKVFLTVSRLGQNNFRNKIHRTFKFFYKYVQKMWKQYCFKPHGLFDKLNLNLVTYRCTSSKVCNLSPKTSSISGQSIHAFSFAFPRGSCSYLKL